MYVTLIISADLDVACCVYMQFLLTEPVIGLFYLLKTSALVQLEKRLQARQYISSAYSNLASRWVLHTFLQMFQSKGPVKKLGFLSIETMHAFQL